jgi:hypothetical protein
MTTQRLNQLMILTISRAAQLAYVEEASGAFSYLSAADRFFRYHASADRTATLGEELDRLADLAAIDSGFSLDVSGPGDRGSLFIERLSLIDAALELADLSGEEGSLSVEVASAEGEAACRLSRGGERRLVRRA